MLKTVGYAFAVCLVATVAIGWSQKQSPAQQPIQPVETISPEKLTVGHGALSELKFTDMSFVFTDAN